MLAPSRLATVSNWLLTLTVVLTFSVSAMALSAMGIKYDDVGGNFLHKLHPATWVAAFALAAKLLSERNLLDYLARFPGRFPGVVYFMPAWAMIILHAVVVQHAPIMPLVDTFFSGIVFLILYTDADAVTQRRIQLFLHLFLFVNACLGIGEFVTHKRLTPYVTGGRIILHDYRSTALLGHPLINASTSAAYVLMLVFGAERKISWPLRLLLIGVQIVALVSFGGRSAIVLCVVLSTLGLVRPAAELLVGKQFEVSKAIFVTMTLPFVIGAVFVAWSGGHVDQFLERFTNDKGSAQARVVMFQLFDDFSWEELLLAPDRMRLGSLMNLYGIEYGIESSWLGLIFQYGLLMSLLFLSGFFVLLWDSWRRAAQNATILVIFLLIQASSAAGISVKSALFNQFVMMLLAIMAGRSSNRGAATDVPRSFQDTASPVAI